MFIQSNSPSQVVRGTRGPRAVVGDTVRHGQKGFSLLEMVVAMMIVTVGLLGVASSIGYALMASNSGRGITNAKLLVVSMLEQMESLRNSGQLNFDEISNTAYVNGSTFPGFPNGFVPISSDPGPDAIYGTADDGSGAGVVLVGAQRKVVISLLSPTLKKIEVTVRYSANGGKSTDLVGVSYLNDDMHGNYVP